MIIPAYLPFYVVGSSVAIIATMIFGLNLALKRAHWAHALRTSAVRAASVVLIGWFAGAVALSWFAAFEGVSDRIPTIQYGITVPILVGALLMWRSQLLARILEAVPQSWLVGVQLYRALGVIFLILYAAGSMPALFAWPAGAGDVAVGLLAPLVALGFARDPGAGVGSVLAWNVFGLADLAVAVGAGFLTSPSPLQLFAFDSPNELISAYPLVLVPVYLVPLSVLLHFASLAKLKRAGRTEREAIAV